MNPDRSKPVVGETLIAVTPEGRCRTRREETVQVTEVGRKYFTCDRYGKFFIDSWMRAGDNVHINFPILLYRTEQDMRDEEEHLRLVADLSKKLVYRSNWEKLTLDQLRKINDIVCTPSSESKQAAP